MKKQDETATKTALLLMAAGLAGATVTLLLAPQSGKKTRRAIQQAGQSLAERAEAFQEDLGERVESLVEDTLAMAEQGVNKGMGMTDKLQEDLLSTLQTSQELISRQIERAHSLLQK